MSTFEQEVREEPPEPEATVDAFNDAQALLIEAVTTMHETPNKESMIEVNERLNVCRSAIDPFEKTTFFKDAENPLAITLSVSTVVSRANELIAKIKTINPDHGISMIFKPGSEAYLEACILEDEEAVELDQVYKDNIENEGMPPPETSAASTCNVYRSTIGDLESALWSSEKVTQFLVEITEQQARSESRQFMLKHVGHTVLAAFAGAFLANIFKRP